jgi:hypothetical protein
MCPNLLDHVTLLTNRLAWMRYAELCVSHYFLSLRALQMRVSGCSTFSRCGMRRTLSTLSIGLITDKHGGVGRLLDRSSLSYT